MWRRRWGVDGEAGEAASGEVTVVMIREAGPKMQSCVSTPGDSTLKV
jgi:hypothetical protein